MKRLNHTSTMRSALIAYALAIGVFASSPTAKAQSGSILGTANVPFAFQAGSQMLPAGVYEIHRVSKNLLDLRGSNQVRHFVLVNAAEMRQAADKGTMVFHHFGDTYFLSQIWEAGATFGAECAESQAEKEISRKTNRPTAGLTQVALNSTSRR